MRPHWLHSITRLLTTPAWVGRGALLLAWVASGSVARAAAGITLTIDCAFCGRDQAFPHDCSQGRKSATGLAAPNPLPALLDEARRQHRRLLGVSGVNLPDLGDVETLGQLDASLASLIAATEAEIERCERERAEFVRKGATVDTERARLSQLASQLNEQIDQMRREIGETERETAAQIRAATTARDEIRQLQKSLTDIRGEIRQVRNRLFPRLHQASSHGWILPPSNYRPTPNPLPVTTEPDRFQKLTADGSPIPMPRSDASRIHANPLSNTVSVQPAGVASQQAVQSKLDELPVLWERARTSVARRADAIRSLDVQRSETDVHSAQLSALEPQRAILANQVATTKRNATIAHQTVTEYEARLVDARATTIYAWIEWGIFQLLDKKAEALLAGKAGKESNPANSTFLTDWREVAATAVELGSDPLSVIARLPAVMSARGESLDGLQQDLAGTREKFGLGFVAANAKIPAPAVPYLTKASR